MKRRIKLFNPDVGSQEVKAVKNVLLSQFWASGAGVGKVKEFEDSLNKYIGSDTCVALNSGTAALHLAISLYDVKGKDVLVPSLTFVTTVHSIVYNGGRPVFIDVDPETLCISIEDLKQKLTSNAVAILPVHFGGYPCDLASIRDIAEDRNLHIVEDAAHSCGSTFKNERIGSHSETCCFSFHPVKNLAMPGGGAITLSGVDSKSKRKTLESRRWCGIQNRQGIYYDVAQLGWNYYMNELSAAIGLVQLAKLDKMNETRKKIAHAYSLNLQVDHKMPYSEECCYHLYWVRVRNRDDFIDRMNKAGIEVGLHYRPAHLMTMYRSYARAEELPNTEGLWKELVTLPMHTCLTDEEVNYIVEKSNEYSRTCDC